ncbi:MAG TPA: TetR/AcrR family transcriptional regulator [Mycobacteriales bacterium]|jgi:Transcriptional regulator
MSVDVVREPKQSPGATRRRGEALERAIFEATVEELRLVGYGRLTMEGVAARAHTGKAALYRRWASRGELVVDTLEYLLPSPGELPDHGTVREDLLDLLRRIQTMVDCPSGCAIEALMADAKRDETFVRVLHERVIEPRRQQFVEVLRRGVERGHVHPAAATPLVASVGPSMVLLHCLVGGPPVTDAYLVSIVDEVLLPLLDRAD